MEDQSRDPEGITSCHQFDNRINKRDLFVCLALWMEQSPLATTTTFLERTSVKDFTTTHKRKIEEDDMIGRKKLKTQDCLATDIPESDTFSDDQEINKVGVVIVDHDDRIVAIDCSREGLHAVVNALVMHSHKVKGCDVFVSRKPCSLCTKFMVQMNINRVYYLPFEPEIPTLEDFKQSEQMYRVSAIAQSVYVPVLNKGIVEETSLRRSPYTTPIASNKEFTKALLDQYWNDAWIARIPEALQWPGFVQVSEKVHQQIYDMLQWIAKVTIVDVPQTTTFHVSGHSNGLSTENIGEHSLVPNENNLKWQEFARHMTRLAHLLSQRSDDPTRGVGAVITRNNDIIAVGWNGFPSKAMYGDFPRAGDSDKGIKDKKYPFSIHAEQNAVLTRFVEDIKHKTTTLFVSKMPCDDCVPIISRVGIKNVVFPPPRQKLQARSLKYGLLTKYNAAGHFKCFVSANGLEETPCRALSSQEKSGFQWTITRE